MQRGTGLRSIIVFGLTCLIGLFLTALQSNGQQYDSVELKAIRDLVASKIAQATSKGDAATEIDKLQRVHAVLGVLIDIYARLENSKFNLPDIADGKLILNQAKLV